MSRRSEIKSRYIFIFGLIFFPAVIMINQVLHGQNTEIIREDEKSEKPEIKWISQFSGSSDLNNRDNLPRRFLNFLFGIDDFRLIRPVGIITYDTQKWIILDQGLEKIVVSNQTEGKIQLLKSNTNLPSLVGVCRGAGDSIYFTDSYLNKIYVLRANEPKVNLMSDTLALSQPTGIAYLESTDEVWVVETGRHRIVILNRSGEIIRYLGSRGVEPGEFNFPTFIWIDNRGTVYIVDSMNFRVQIFSKEGRLLSVFGEAGDATGYFARPKGIATDSHGNIYVVDAVFHTVQIFDSRGNYLSNFGEQGGEAGQFWLPMGIYIDQQDRIYVADSYNARIQVFQLITRGDSEN